ncbi:hypothetical protein BU25DRAFT_462730 [Macroventuria anomochaeta]|uniref:Uncharacterized protein n=1 Tax=Macroventuria anomochaeta TaxID=301207 RepID=A0ACB6RNV6_9PLEO|nr:uncharacterized protein BU25DRAFT_462730 [Macroventuria anomochaeta]KAF2622627.1 hypothetical protein BU25DRAFT_462730 [Macroventuria anomochaeta]
MSHSSEDEEKFRKGDESSGQSSKPEKNTDKGTEDMIIMRAGTDVVQDSSHLSLAHTPKSNDESFRLAARNVSTLSGSKLETRTKISEAADMTTNDSDSALLNHETDARRPQTADRSNSHGSASVVVEHLIDQYASPFDDLSDPPLVDLKYTHPRPSPTVPKRGPLHFMKRRNSTPTRTSTRSKPASRNFRKLRLDVQQSDVSIKKTEPGSDSPEWACQTSLAIEAGRISMDNVSLRSRESTSLNHISKAMRSPIKTLSTGHRKVQSAGTRGRRNTYPSPSSEYSLALSTSGRHSEGAMQAAQREGAVHQTGRLEGMEKALGKEPSRRDSAQVASPMDLNKSLPALPSQESGKEGEE